jgi:hypothetical protein
MTINPEELDKEKNAIQVIHGEMNALSATMYCLSSTQETIDLYSEGVGVHMMFQYLKA